MNKLIFDLISYQLLSIDRRLERVKKMLLIYFFKQGDNFITDPLWGVYLTFAPVLQQRSIG